MWNNIKVSLLLLLILGVIGFVSSAYYVTDPNNCPTSYQSQSCSGIDHVCGYSGGVTFCYDPDGIDPPVGSATTTGSGGSDLSCEDTACSGGYVIDCYYYDGSAPHCDNGATGFIDRNPTCYNKHVQTTATGGSFVTSTCSATCTTNYFACDGDTTDADGCEINAGASCGSSTGTIVNNQCYSSTAGNCTSSTRLDCDNSDSDSNPATCNVGNGCEILIGGACSVGTLSGTYGTTCTGSSGTCLLTPQHFITSTNTQYQSNATNPFLWGVDYNVGHLLNISWSVGGGIYVNATGLWFNGTLLGSGGAESDPIWSANYTAYNSSWSSITNTSYMTGDNFTTQNTSMVNYITVQNTSMTNWITNTFNVTRNNYVAAVNTSMKNYVDAQNTSQTNYINVQNTSVSNALNTKLNLTGGNMTGLLNVTGSNITIGTGNFICLNYGCSQWIKANVTGVFVQG